MTRQNINIITLFAAVVLIPTLTCGVGIGLIKSANREVRSLFHTPGVTNSFLQCFVDQSQRAFPVHQQAHLRTVTDVIRSFVRKRTITDTDALMFQTEVASSLVDVVVNEPSRPEDYARSLDVLVKIVKNCYLQSTGKTTTDLIAVVETFTKLFVDVIANVGKSPTSLKISEDDQRLLHSLQEVEKFGSQVNEPLGISLGSQRKTGPSVSKVFQSDGRKPSGGIGTSIGAQSSADANANLPLLNIPLKPISPSTSINTANLNAVNTFSLNSTTTGAAVSKPLADNFSKSQSGISKNSFLLPQVNNINSNSAIDSTFNQQNIASSSATIPKNQVPAQTVLSSTLAATNPQSVQASTTKGNEQVFPRNNFPESVKNDLPKRRVTRSISSIPVDQNLNKISFNTSMKKNNQSDVKNNFRQKLIMNTVKKLIKSGNEQIILDFMKHVAFKENTFEPKFLNQTKEQASELLMTTITSLPMATTFPKFIEQFLSTIHSPEYINYFTRSLHENVQGTSQSESSDKRMKEFVKAFIDGVVDFLTPFSSKHTMDIKRKKRDTANNFPQDDDQHKLKSETNPPSAQASPAVVSEALASPETSDKSSSSVIITADSTPNDSFKTNDNPQTYPVFSPTVPEAMVSSAAFAEANNHSEVDSETIKGNINSFLLEYSESKNKTSDSGKSSISPASEKRRQPPAVVSEFASAFSKAVAASEAITAAVGLTLHGPTADNAIYDIMFETLSEKGASDPSIGSRLDNSSHPSASNFDGVTPLVLTNALSAAVADALLDEKLLTYESIPTIIESYIQILGETLDQLEANDDPELNSKALVIGTERFISSRGISVLHGATELASHFKEDFIYAWEEILNNRPKNSIIPDTRDKESDEHKLNCKANPSNPESFSRYLLNELSESKSMQGLFLLPPLTNETAAAFYQSFYSAALSLGIDIPKPDSDLIWKVLSDNLDTKSPVFFATIYAVSLERFLCQKGVLKGQNPLPLSRLFAEVLNRAPISVSTSNRKPEDYFDQLINATFHFLISLLVVKPKGSPSWTSSFLSELSSTSPVTFPKLIREVAPEILSPAGLGHPDATKRIFDLTVALSHDVLSPYNPTIDVPAYAERLKVIKSEIRESNPALKPIGLTLGTFLEGISGIVTLINAATIPTLHVEVGDSSSVQSEFLNVLPSLL